MSARTIQGMALLFAAFAVSLIIRYPYFGTLSEGHHQWLTASSIKFVDNWIEDGAYNDGFLFLEQPKSIESYRLADRDIYPSYPPGSAIPAYAIKQLFPELSTLVIIQAYNLLNHLAVAITIFAIVHLSLSTVNFIGHKYHYSLLAGISYLFLPKPLYWHSMVYFADQAAILPFSLTILLELKARLSANHATKFLVAQASLLFIMMLIDYLAIPLAIAVFGFRLVDPIRSNTKSHTTILYNAVQLFVPLIMALLIFGWQLIHYNLLGEIFHTFMFRAALSEAGASYVHYDFPLEIANHLGVIPQYILLVVIIFTSYRYIKHSSTVDLPVLIGLVASVIHGLLLSNHSLNHEFSGLKLFVPLSISFFGIIPAILSSTSPAFLTSSYKVDPSVKTDFIRV
jgi:hypothetical protein